MSEFRVDRPGRYRTLDGEVALVTSTTYPGGYIDGTISGVNHLWRSTGNWYFTRDDETDLDLIAYLGPLEEGRPCTCHPGDNPPVPCAKQYALTECKAVADPAISDAAWARRLKVKAAGKEQHEDQYKQHGLVLRTREEWEQQQDADIATLCKERDDALSNLTAANAEIERLTRELDDEWALLREYMRVETLGEVVLPKKRPAQALESLRKPRVTIPLTTPQIDRYTMPMLGTQR